MKKIPEHMMKVMRKRWDLDENDTSDDEYKRVLTCKGCEYEIDFPSHASCHGCTRVYPDKHSGS